MEMETFGRNGIQRFWSENISGASNPGYREEWVCATLRELADSADGDVTLLDVGAGEAPYKKAILGMGIAYRSHDFGAYVPDDGTGGIVDSSWIYDAPDILCDVLEIPTRTTFDIVLCTEVFEHVPRPSETFDLLARLVSPGGYLVTTAPLQSLMHQAPFWFAAGLSPFWYAKLAGENGLEIKSLAVFGDYADVLAQELARALSQKFLGHRFLNFFLRVCGWLIRRSAPLIRKGLGSNLLKSTGFGVLFVGKKLA